MGALDISQDWWLVTRSADRFRIVTDLNRTRGSRVVRRAGFGLLAILLLGAVVWSLASASTQKSIPNAVDPIQSAFAVFRSRPEGLPLSDREILGKPTHGLNWSLAQRLPLKPPVRLWAVPGNRYLCLVSRQRPGVVGTSCATFKEASQQGLSVAFLSTSRSDGRGSRVIAGIAPDGAPQVMAVTGSFRARIPVVGGYFERRDSLAVPPDELVVLWGARNS